jgi:uncharacterized repeat protein (TIGR03943 family)
VWAKFFQWRGVIALGVFALATLWLGFEGRLGFYIHPRYNLFTTTMAIIGLVLLMVAVLTHKPHDHHQTRRPRRFRAGDIVSVGITTAVLIALIVLPPTTLSSATAANRSTNEVGVVTPSDSIDAAGSAELFLSLTVRDWAGLLLQTQSPSFYRGKPVDTIGIVTPSELADDVFNLTRFVVTCCAVDAQPVSIPVYYPGWKQSFPVDSWVRVSGGFSPAPVGVGSLGLVLVPVEIEDQEVPREPYLF